MNILKVFTQKRITGNIGEDAVVRYLRKNRYKILDRNYVAAGHEIDIIAENRLYVCFIEVKARTASKISPKEPRPACAVTPEKMYSIISAAKFYSSASIDKKKLRFDVAEVYLEDNGEVKSINYIEGAFTQSDARKERHR